MFSFGQIFQKYQKSYNVGWHIFQKYYSVVTPMPKLVSLIYDTVNNLDNKRIIFVIYFIKITLFLHPGSQYHVNIIGTQPHNLPSSSILPPLLIYMVLPPPNLEDIPNGMFLASFLSLSLCKMLCFVLFTYRGICL